MKIFHLICVSLIVIGLGMRCLARYKIRSICEKYPIEEQLKHGPCCEHGGPWPQKTNVIALP